MNELIAKLKKLSIFKHKWVQFLMYLIKNFIDDNCSQKAALLTYTTLLSIVPILTLLFVILSTIPQLAGVREQIQNAIENASWKVTEEDESTRMDDNGVNVTEQSVELVRNAYQLQYTMQAISGDLAALGTAVIYNMGTNIIFGEISFITKSIAAILQLGVTVDYSVFLMDRFEEEKKHHDTKKDAMAAAIDSTFLSLMGSSLTTVFGSLALCFMSFTLGKDMGLVMAKGVILGVITVVTFLPSLILMLDNVIEKTRHKSLAPKFNKISDFAIKHRRVIAIIFLVLFIPSYFLQNNVKKYYNMDKAIPQDLPSISALNTMKKDFNMATTHFIILDDKITEANINALTSELNNVEGVTNVLSLNSFIGKAIPSAMLPDSIKEICVQDGKQLMMLNSSYSAAPMKSMS